MRVLLIVHGFVQGVGYRHFVKRVADRYNVKGMVKNLDDGSVRIVAEGDDDAVESFKKTINVDILTGPQVKSIEEFAEGSESLPRDPKRYGSFQIERDSS